MTTLKITIVMITLMFTTGNIVGAQEMISDEKAIRDLEKKWTFLLEKKDTSALKEIWTEAYVVNNVNGSISTRKQILNVIKSGHNFPKIRWTIEQITFNGPIASVMGSETELDDTGQNPAPGTTTRRFTNIWIKQKSDWKMVARQATPICSK